MRKEKVQFNWLTAKVQHFQIYSSIYFIPTVKKRLIRSADQMFKTILGTRDLYVAVCREGKMFFGKHADIEVSQVVKTRGLQEEKREIVDIPTSKQGASWVLL